MDERIAGFMLKASKFEYFLVNQDITLAKLRTYRDLERIEGVDWQRVAARIERKFPFKGFDFASEGFEIFVLTPPQYLVKRHDGRLKWDSEEDLIDSWDRVAGRSYAQLRNNIAHGNKAQLPAPFTHSRTEQFLDAGERFIEFVATQVFNYPHWERPIEFR